MKVLSFLILALFFWCFPQTDNLKPFHLSGYTQGTTYHITYYAKDSLVNQGEIEFMLAGIDSSLSVYKSYSLISRFNVSNRAVKADQHLKAVVNKSKEVFEKTGGIFDITIQPLVEAWGFGAKAGNDIPDSAAVGRLMNCVGMEKLHLSKDSLVKDSRCLQIDVNGIAQGYSVDILASYLEQRGIRNYLVEIGGEIRIKGRRQPDGGLMSVGVEGPADDFNPEPLQKILFVGDGAITTSGNYRKYYQKGNRKISHLIDARTGYPIQNELISVTLWAKDAITADGYDNALMGMGLENALAFTSRQKNLEAYLIYHKPDGSVADTASAGFYKLMKKDRY